MTCVTTSSQSREIACSCLHKLQELNGIPAAIFSLGWATAHHTSIRGSILHRYDVVSPQGMDRNRRLCCWRCPYMAWSPIQPGFVAQSIGSASIGQYGGLIHRDHQGHLRCRPWMVVLGILSVLLRVIVFLFGGKSEREVNLQIGHVITDV